MISSLSKGLFADTLSMEDADDTIEQRIAALIEMSGVDDDSFNAVNWQIAVNHVIDNDDAESALGLYKLLDDAQVEVLEQCIKDGPIEDGDVASKVARDRLMDLGLVTKVVVAGEDGKNACTQIGYLFWQEAGNELDDATGEDGDD